MLSLYFQSELRPFVTPGVEVSYGDMFPITVVYSIPAGLEFAIFGVLFLVLAVVFHRERKHLSVGMAACGVVDAALLLVWWM